MTPEDAHAAAWAEDDAEFEAALAAEREALQAAALANGPEAVSGMWEQADLDGGQTDVTFDPECDRCNYARHICPGCGTDLHHGLDVCPACVDWLAAEQVEVEEAVRLHQDEVRRRQEARLAEALEKAGPEPEPVDVTGIIEEARRDLRRGR